MIIVSTLLFLSNLTIISQNLFPYETLMKIREKSIFLILDEKIYFFIKNKDTDIIFKTFLLIFIILFVLYVYATMLNTVSNTVLDRQLLSHYLTIKMIHYIVQALLNLKKTFLLILFFIVPFAHFFSNSIGTSIVILSNIALSLIVSRYYSKQKNIYYIWFLKKWLFINLPITFAMLLVTLIFYNMEIKFNLSNLHSFTLLYTIVSFMRIVFKLFCFLISSDYVQAQKHKKLLYNLSAYIPARYIVWRKNSTDLLNSIDETKDDPLFTSKLKMMKKRKIVIQDRNYINLAISAGCAFAAFFSILFFIIPPVKELEYSLLVTTIFFILILLIRLLSRSFEILKAFIADALSSAPKKSTLTKSDRIKLILISLLEIVILSVGLKMLYSIFIIPNLIHLSTELSKDILIDFFDIWAVQLFNVSFSNDVDFLPALVHIIQISISACLILLSLAVYSGHKNNTSIYEMTKENGIYYFSETFIVNTVEDNENVRTIEGDEKMNHTRYSPPKRDFSGFKKDWEEDRIDTELFEQIEFCYKELENKEALHQEQTDFLLKLFDDIQKIKGFFKKLNRF